MNLGIDARQSTTTKTDKGWGSFWEFQKNSFHGVMRIATSYFAKQIKKRYALNEHHALLDYGCGPGFLMEYLSDTDTEITGVDINTFFMEQARAQYPGTLLIHITQDVAQNKEILDTALQGKQFDFIVLLSIVQYFPDVESVEEVVELFSFYTAPSGKIIIADVIDKDTSSIRDALALLRHCVIRGKIIPFFRFIFFVLFSDYAQVSKRNRLLEIDENDIDGIAKRNSLRYEKVTGLTFHPTRKNYVLQKK